MCLHNAMVYAGETWEGTVSGTEFLEAWSCFWACLVGTVGSDTSVIFANQWQPVVPKLPCLSPGPRQSLGCCFFCFCTTITAQRLVDDDSRA